MDLQYDCSCGWIPGHQGALCNLGTSLIMQVNRIALLVPQQMFGWSPFPVIMTLFGQKESNPRKLVQEWRTEKQPQDEFLNSPDCIFGYTIPEPTLLLSIIINLSHRL